MNTMDITSMNTDTVTAEMKITSKSFDDGASIPKKYTCDGINVNPALDIAFIPQETVSIAIIMEDPDAPISTWIHWLVWNIPVMHQLPEHLKKGNCGMNDFSKTTYCGPCPMSGRHQYVFKVYALDILLDLPPTTRKPELIKKMKGHILAYGELKARYGRSLS